MVWQVPPGWHRTHDGPPHHGPAVPPEAKIEQAVAASPDAPQLELAWQCGISRSTVGRVVRVDHAAMALAGRRVFSGTDARSQSGMA